MTRAFIYRIALNSILLVSLLFMPYWVSALVLLVLIMSFLAFEALFWGLLFDVLYATSLPLFFGFIFVGTTTALLFFLAGLLLKRRLIFYA